MNTLHRMSPGRAALLHFGAVLFITAAEGSATPLETETSDPLARRWEDERQVRAFLCSPNHHGQPARDYDGYLDDWTDLAWRLLEDPATQAACHVRSSILIARRAAPGDAGKLLSFIRSTLYDSPTHLRYSVCVQALMALGMLGNMTNTASDRALVEDFAADAADLRFWAAHDTVWRAHGVPGVGVGLRNAARSALSNVGSLRAEQLLFGLLDGSVDAADRAELEQWIRYCRYIGEDPSHGWRTRSDQAISPESQSLPTTPTATGSRPSTR